MTQTEAWNGETFISQVMVTATRSGSAVPLEVASKALILMGERYPKQYKECMGDAMLGDV